MKRLIVIATLVCSGCLFTGSEPSDDDGPTNLNGIPNNSNNIAPNNVSPNNVPPNNISPNNVDPNNVDPPNNIEPPNSFTCIETDPDAACLSQFTCSGDATPECLRCGYCPAFCAPPSTDGGRNQLGFCVNVIPGDFIDDADGEAGAAVAVNDGNIFLGRPGFESGEVIVFSQTGVLTDGRLRESSSASRFGEVVAAHGDVAVVGCPRCNNGEGAVRVYSEGDWESPIAPLATSSLAGLGAAVDVRQVAVVGSTFIAAGAPSESTVLLVRVGAVGSPTLERFEGATGAVGFGTSVSLSAGRIAIGQLDPMSFTVHERIDADDWQEEVEMFGFGKLVELGPGGVAAAASNGQTLAFFRRSGGAWISVGEPHTLPNGEWTSIAATTEFFFAGTSDGAAHAFVVTPDTVFHAGTVDQFGGPVQVAASSDVLVVATPGIEPSFHRITGAPIEFEF